jgi:hypothetical protein
MIRTIVFLLGASLAAGAAAQTQRAQDAIDRSLQERAARERGLMLRLDEVPPVPHPIAPQEVTRNITLPTPGTEILQREPPPQLPQRANVALPAPAVPTSQQLLDDSQRRRQVELQTQLPPAAIPNTGEDVARQQALQMQSLQFQREQSASQLGSTILRNSERAMGR